MKTVKKVNAKQCIGTIILCVIFAAVLFVPFSLSGNFSFGYTHLKFIGDASIAGKQATLFEKVLGEIGAQAFLTEKIHLSVNVYNTILKYVNEYGVLIYAGAIAVDVAFAVILFIIRLNVLRIIFKTISIIIGVALILLNLVYMSCFIGFLMNINIDTILTDVFASGAVFFLGLAIFSKHLVFRQFYWFSAKKVEVKDSAE